MDFSRPTLKTLGHRIQSDLAAELELKVPFPKASILSALSFSLAGVTHLIYERIDSLVNQLYPDTATGESLKRIAGLFGVYPRGKTRASFFVKFQGDPGTLIPKKTSLTSLSEIQYVTEEEGRVGGQDVWVSSTQEGSQGNVEPGSTLTLLSSIAGVKKEAEVLSFGYSIGFDEEEEESLRLRLLHHLRNPGQGGNRSDYIQWAQSVSGVGRVWITALPNSLTLVLSFLTVDPNYPLPSDELIKKVEKVILNKKPLGVKLSVTKLIALPISVEMKCHESLTRYGPLIERELKRYFLKKVAPGQRISPFVIFSLISNITRSHDFTLIAPSTEISPSENEIAVLGSFTCQSQKLS